MDKLKQVQKYQFWILLAVALILPFVGWFMARSGFISEAEARASALKTLSEQIKTDARDPNGDWDRGLAQINVEQEMQKIVAWKELFDHQKPFMIWPKGMVDDPESFQPLHQEIYRTSYERELLNVREIVKPLDEDKGLVEYPGSLLVYPEWYGQSLPPTPRQIEAAQEDLWLLTSLLKAIAKVNEEAQTQFDAPVKQIDDLTLRGGSPKGGGGAAPGAGSGSGAPKTGGATMPGSDMAAKMSSLMGSGANKTSAGGIGGGGGGGGIANADIDVNEDLGPERDAAADPTASKTPGTNAKTGSPGKDRYREEKPEWKTRGFKLKVVMDQKRVPDLLVSLENSDWPLNILHVQIADTQDEDLQSADGGIGEMTGGGHGGNSPRPGGGGGGIPGAPPGGGLGGSGLGGGMKKAGPAKRPAVRASDDEGESVANSRSALDDPNLVNVTVVGVIYIFKKPKDVAPPPTSPGAPPAGAPASSLPAGGPVAANNAAAPPATAAAKSETGNSADAEDAADAVPEAAGAKDEPSDDDPEPSSDKPEPAAESGKKAPAADAKPASPK